MQDINNMVKDKSSSTSGFAERDRALLDSGTKIESPVPGLQPPVWLRNEQCKEDDSFLLGAISRPASSENVLSASAVSNSDAWMPFGGRSLEGLFAPKRPQTPGPDFHFGRTSETYAQPKPVRKSSEAVAIDRLFESLGQVSLGSTQPASAETFA